MKHVVNHRGIEFYVFRRSPMEYAAMVSGVPTAGSPTIEGAEQQGRAVIDSGAPTVFSTTVAWPDGNTTSRLVDVGTATGCLRFSEFMWRTLAKGAAITIQQRTAADGFGNHEGETR